MLQVGALPDERSAPTQSKTLPEEAPKRTALYVPVRAQLIRNPSLGGLPGDRC